MKKSVYILLFAWCLPVGLQAQNVEDDLYYVPSKNKVEKSENSSVRKSSAEQKTTNIYTSPGSTVVIRSGDGKARDVDEYNRRYSKHDDGYTVDNDTLYIDEEYDPDLDGEWLKGGFNGSDADYEYAKEVILFRGPRFAISVSSPLYWELVYGVDSGDWNVYTDGIYAYAFPTFSNPLWWNWRYNWYYGWHYPYYSWWYYPGYWGGWYGYWYPHHWGHPAHNWGWSGGKYWAHSLTNRSSYMANRYSTSTLRQSGYNRMNASRSSSTISNNRASALRGQSVSRRGTSSTSRATGVSSSGVRRNSTYTRPSSTRVSSGSSSSAGSGSVTRIYSNRSREAGSVTRSGVSTYSSPSRSTSTYSRGSSTSSSRVYSGETHRSSGYSVGNRSSSARTYSPSIGGSSSRSMSGSRAGGSSRSSGGGASRGGRR